MALVVRGRTTRAFELLCLAPPCSEALFSKALEEQTLDTVAEAAKEFAQVVKKMFPERAEFYNAVERKGAWPQALQSALISLIPKGEGGEQ